MKRFQVLGVNDDRDFCECCGKHPLKKVVWMEDLESGEIRHFGTTCVTRQAALKGTFDRDTQKDIKRAINSYQDMVKASWSAGRRQYKAEGGKTRSVTDERGVIVASKVTDSAHYDRCVAEAFERIKEQRKMFSKVA